MLLPPSPALAGRLKRAGIVHPIWTYEYTRFNAVPLSVGCAILMLETGGGANEFGHDPSVAYGWGTVTKAKYLAYTKLRDATNPPRCQGVGPMQLTNKAEQDLADSLGGCWDPRWNIATGMHYIGELLRAHPGDLHAGIEAYNGSGPAAVAYADRALVLAAHFRAELGQ